MATLTTTTTVIPETGVHLSDLTTTTTMTTPKMTKKQLDDSNMAKPTKEKAAVAGSKDKEAGTKDKEAGTKDKEAASKDKDTEVDAESGSAADAPNVKKSQVREVK